MSERRVHTLQNKLEETKALLDQFDRSRRQAEQELADTNEHLTDLTMQHNNLMNTNMKLNVDYNDLKVGNIA